MNKKTRKMTFVLSPDGEELILKRELSLKSKFKANASNITLILTIILFIFSELLEHFLDIKLFASFDEFQQSFDKLVNKNNFIPAFLEINKE